MILALKKTTFDVKTQISNIWTGVPNIRSSPACLQTRAIERSDSAEHVSPVNRTARHLPAFHAQVLEVVRAFLEPRKQKPRHRAQSLLKIRLEESSLSRTNSSMTASSAITLTVDAWAFGSFWPFIQEICQTSENLYEHIRLRQAEIKEIREAMRPSILLIPAIQQVLETGTLSMIPNGISGSYFLLDADGTPHFVIKPLDEDIGAINNPKGYASPFIDSPLRDGVPLYRSCFREVAAYRMAEMIGVASIVPRTDFTILQSDQFFDLSQNVRPSEMQRYFDRLGRADKEKLCSVQEFVAESKTLFEAAQDLQSSGLTDEEIEHLIDQEDFENANILLWATGDTDGHFGNFLVTPKRVDEIGNQVFGLKKIDNGLAFPEKNGQLINSLVHLPNASRSLSSAALSKIQTLDSNALTDCLAQHGLEGSMDAMRDRIYALQTIVRNNPTMSIKSINKQLSKIHEKLV